jgi:hypothetical protein
MSMPIRVFGAILRPRFPLTNALVNDWANHANYGTVFLIGASWPIVCGGNGVRPSAAAPVATWTVKASNESKLHRISIGYKYNGNGRSHCFGGESSGGFAGRKYHRNPTCTSSAASAVNRSY